MQICYVDESGDTQALPTATRNVAPVCVVVGASVNQNLLQNLTHEFLTLKRSQYPGLRPPGATRLSWMLEEVKGSDLRRAMRTDAPRRNRRHTIHFLDKVVTLLEDYEVKIFGRIWIKGIGDPINETAIYTSSVQAICGYFQNLLTTLDDSGVVIADSRHFTGNVAVSHSVFTQKFKLQGDDYGRIMEMPTFGHSNNHAMIQITDVIGSALLFPMATYAFCSGHVRNVLVDANFGHLTSRYGTRLRSLQHRYRDPDGRWRGGMTVDDKIAQRAGGALFQI
jgi:hypothetical protein